jgi:hypothetical protein
MRIKVIELSWFRGAAEAVSLALQVDGRLRSERLREIILR